MLAQELSPNQRQSTLSSLLGSDNQVCYESDTELVYVDPLQSEGDGFVIKAVNKTTGERHSYAYDLNGKFIDSQLVLPKFEVINGVETRGFEDGDPPAAAAGDKLIARLKASIGDYDRSVLR